MSTAAKVFTERTLGFRFAILGNIILLFVVVAQPFLIISATRTKERFVIMQRDGSYVIAPTVEFADAKEIHEKCTLDAVYALFMRNPRGADRPTELRRLFLENALKKAEALIQREEGEFKTNEIHQKIESLEITIQKVTDTQVRVNVEANLVRSGRFSTRATLDKKVASVLLTLDRNPNMYLNDQYPLSVWDFEVTYR